MYIDKSLRSFSSAREKWGQKQKCCVYNFVQYVYVCVYIYIYMQHLMQCLMQGQLS